MQLPKKIDPCPIVESIIEIRLISAMPVEEFLGKHYNMISNILPKLTTLDPNRIPYEIRSSDENFKYLPCFQFENDNYLFRIATSSLSFGIKGQYTGWEDWEKVFSPLISAVNWENDYKVQRIGLRYINIFREAIFDNVKVKVEIDSASISHLPTTIHNEQREGNNIVILNLANLQPIGSVPLTQGPKPLEVPGTSSIDIDCIRTFPSLDNPTVCQILSIIKELHNLEKKTFFNLLKPGYLNKLNPTY